VFTSWFVQIGENGRKSLIYHRTARPLNQYDRVIRGSQTMRYEESEIKMLGLSSVFN